MIKREFWNTKAKKRTEMKKDRGIVDFMMILHHFFKNFEKWVSEMKDPRHQSYTTYSQKTLVYMGILKNIFGLVSMRSMDEMFNKAQCIKTLKLISGAEVLDEMPHYDTLNNYLEKLDVENIAELRKKMIKNLVRMKSFYRSRLFGNWRIILDGTGLYYFKEKHCENCLVTTRKNGDGKEVKMYYHKVVEAKLVLADNVVISIDTEFIENENENVTKQDCELNAAKRLMARLKKNYPGMPVCIQGDALYAVEPVMKICRKNGWHYLLTHKGGNQKLLEEMYEYIKKGGGTVKMEKLCEENGTGQYANHVETGAGKKETANIFEYEYEYKEKQKIKKNKIMWVTDIGLTKKNLEEMIIAGRGRWKIENEGFNSQKNGIYDIEHLNSRNKNAMKNHYLLTQIADIIMQLFLAWNPYIRKIGQTIKNTSSKLLESFRIQTVTEEDVSYITRYTTIYLE